MSLTETLVWLAVRRLGAFILLSGRCLAFWRLGLNCKLTVLSPSSPHPLAASCSQCYKEVPFALAKPCQLADGADLP